MSRQKEYFLIVDTETCNTIEEPLPYDIGYCICDREGNIYLERSFVVADIFCDMQDLMQSAYYADKIPQYWEDIKNGTRLLRTYTTVRKTMLADMKEYKVKKVGAYNMAFDKRATNNGIRYNTYSFYRWFFPYGTEFFDIWNMACSSFLRSKHFIKWALKNGFVSAAGNIQTSAEVAYRYITKNVDFIENHTGLEDVEIETEIFFKVLRCKMNYDSTIVGSPWRIVQNARKEFGL